jgi:hypothetical protein
MKSLSKLKLFSLILLFTLVAVGWLTAQVPWSGIGQAPRIIFVGTADASISGGTTNTVMPTGWGTNWLAGNSAKAGKAVLLSANGSYCHGTSSTLYVNLKLGGTSMLSELITPADSITNGAWVLNATLTPRTVGAAATWVANGNLVMSYGTGVTNSYVYPLSNAGAYAASTTKSVGTTTNLTIDLRAGYAADGSVVNAVPTNKWVTHNLVIGTSR